MKIGITFRDDLDLHQVWFSSGIAQNLKFYYDLFTLLGHDVFWITNKDFDFSFKGNNYSCKTRTQLLDLKIDVDLIIEAGTTLGTEEQKLFREACGCKVIGLRCGHQYVIASEGLFIKKDLPRNQFNGGQDVMWLLPHYADQAPWIGVLHGCEALEVPYIWEADFIEKSFEDIDSLSQPDIVVMEPNISVTKNALIPMTVLQKLFDDAPDVFGKAYVHSSDNFASADYFLYNFVTCMPVLRASREKVYFRSRMPFTTIFDKPHVLLSHQFHNTLNNLYKEAIYMGIPLVHNSPPYAEVGYYYQDYDAIGAADCVKRAVRTHSPKKAAEQGRQFLHSFSIYNQDVQNTYQALLERALDA